MVEAIELREFTKLEQAFKLAPEYTINQIKVWVEDTLAEFEEEVKFVTPKKTGLLQKSIATNPIKVGSFGVEGFVGTSLDYVIPVELGVKREKRTSKRGKEYMYPGFKGYFMFTDTFKAKLPQVEASFERLADRVLTSITQGQA